MKVNFDLNIDDLIKLLEVLQANPFACLVLIIIFGLLVQNKKSTLNIEK